MIHQDHLDPWWIKQILLANHSQVALIFVHNPILVRLLPQQAVDHILDAGLWLESRDIRLRGLPTWNIQQLGNRHLT